MTQASAPQLLIKEINDTYVQNNFKNLREYFQKQNQLLNFNFVEFNFPAAVTNQKIAHGLGLVPQDVIITRLTGAGSITMNWALFDGTNIDITTTDACRIRLFVGSYWNYQTNLGNQPTDTQSVSPILSTIAGLASTITAAVSAAVAAVIATLTPTASLPSGVTVDFMGATVPSGWLLCDGSAVLRTAYPALFTAIGTINADGTTFNLPDLRGRSTSGRDDMGGTAANRITNVVGGSGISGTTLGAVGGLETVILSVAQLPSHGHQVLNNPTGTIGAIAACAGFAGVAAAGALSYVNTGAGSAGNPVIQPSGSGSAHQNMQPTLITNKIIKT